VEHTRRGGTICQRDMYHIFAPEGHGQDGAFLGKKKALSAVAFSDFVRATDAPGLIELPPPVLARIGSVDQKTNISIAGSDLDPVRTVDEVARARLHAKAIESRLPKGCLNAVAEVGRDLHVACLEGAREGALELPLGIGLVELGTGDADPGASAGRSRPNVGRDTPLRP